jgi:hypothetical protein
MKYILFLLLMPLLSNTDCKNKSKEAKPDSAKDSMTVVPPPAVDESLPLCIDQILAKAKKEQPPIQAEKVELYDWNGKQVYLITWQCCDFFNEVYDKDCKRICAPTGGITGKGDGNCPDFSKTAKLIKQLFPLPVK